MLVFVAVRLHGPQLHRLCILIIDEFLTGRPRWLGGFAPSQWWVFVRAKIFGRGRSREPGLRQQSSRLKGTRAVRQASPRDEPARCHNVDLLH